MTTCVTISFLGRTNYLYFIIFWGPL